MDKMILNPGMTIQVGQIYMNKTFNYLLPCLKYHGDELVGKIGHIMKLAIGIGDFLFVKVNNADYSNHIFMLIDPKGPFNFKKNKYVEPAKFLEEFEDFLSWFRADSSYEADYPYDDLITGHLHMIVIKMPEQCINAIEYFKQNKFSRMYSLDEAEKLFMKHTDAYKVITKDADYHIEFTQKINALYNTTVAPKDIKEADFNVDFTQEKFNII